MAEDEMAEVENFAIAENIVVSKVKGKVCLKIIAYDVDGSAYTRKLIHSKGCECGWSDK